MAIIYYLMLMLLESITKAAVWQSYQYQHNAGFRLLIRNWILLIKRQPLFLINIIWKHCRKWTTLISQLTRYGTPACWKYEKNKYVLEIQYIVSFQEVYIEVRAYAGMMIVNN